MKRRNLDFVIILLIAIILLFIYYLPTDVKELLVLHRDYSNFYDLLTTHFVHEDFTNHLLPNMLVYLGAALLLYVSLYALNEKKLFHKLFVANCLIMPFIISLLWIPINRLIWTSATRCFGFSGIVAAFLGSLVFVLLLFLHKQFGVNLPYAYFSTLFLIALIFTLTYITLTEAIIATTISLLILFAAFTYKTIKSININPEIKSKLQEKIKNPIITDLIPRILYLLILVAIVAFSFSLFPAQFIQNATTINILIHYAGFVLGIGTAQLIWQYSHKA